MTSRVLIGIAVLAIIAMGAFFMYPKLNRESHRDDIPQFVEQAIKAYQAQGIGAFVEFKDQSNPQWVQDGGERYIFVINSMSGHLVSHGGGLTDPKGSQQALINYLVALAKEQPAGRWVHYEFNNPRTGEVEIKRAYLKMHDDYI